MPVVGVVACEILELEFAYLLSSDRDIARITIVEDAKSSGLIKAAESQYGLSLRKVSTLAGCEFDASDRLEVVVRVLEIGLHSYKQVLRDAVVGAVKEIAAVADVVMLGYGLCGNSLEGIDTLLEDTGVPVFLPVDEDHYVDDCVGLLIGGRKNYYEEQCKECGTYFMIPGWTSHWRGMLEGEFGCKLDIKMAKRLLRGYKRSLLIPTGVMPLEKMAENIKEFNETFEFGSEVREGTMGILKATWEAAKEFACNTDSAGVL